ncbi:MAG: hypothetical protein Q9160_006063 [Pyrenula sp. 1 TL-2023]
MTLGFLEDLYQQREWVLSYLRPVEEETIFRLMQMRNVNILWSKLRRNPTGRVYMLNTENLASNLLALGLIHSGSLYEVVGISEEHFTRLPTLIGQYARAFNYLADISRYSKDEDVTRNPVDPDTECVFLFWFTLSIQKLIFEAVQLVFPTSTPDIDLIQVPNVEAMMVSGLRVQNGWCPRMIEKVFYTTNFTVFYWLWASNFNALDERDHASCTTSKCEAVVISSEAEYPEKHAEGCDRDCRRYHPNTDHVLEALSSGRIPLIVATPSPSESAGYTFSVSSVDPKQDDPETPYVAFSHVWSGGLGSITEKGIPSCQASHLARVASTQTSLSDGGTAFWIDSVCVPGAAEARNMAIQFMSSTYRKAQTVVVLDDTIRLTVLYDGTGRQSSPEYLLYRIYTSPWSQRVWTYQEGVLAQKLVFQLAHGHTMVLNFPLSEIGEYSRGPLHISTEQILQHHVYMYLRAEVQALNGQVQAINIGTVALQLRWRDTLHRNPNGRNDEILAVGAVLGLDMERLLNEPEGVRRMVLFYRLVGRLYSNIVFSDAPRLQIDGFRWAPKTFLVNDERRSQTDLVEERAGVDCTEYGLRGTYITFSVDQGVLTEYDDTHRLTIVDEQRHFDLVAPSQQNFFFTHILTYPFEMPESIRGTMFIGAAVVEDKNFAGTHQIAKDIDFVGTFQCVVHLAWFRDWETPVMLARFPNGEKLVTGSMRRSKVLLR